MRSSSTKQRALPEIAYPKLEEEPEPAARGFALKERAGALRGVCGGKDGPESRETRRRREAGTRRAADMAGARRREQREEMMMRRDLFDSLSPRSEPKLVGPELNRTRLGPAMSQAGSPESKLHDTVKLGSING
jgi:hypothetical protein